MFGPAFSDHAAFPLDLSMTSTNPDPQHSVHITGAFTILLTLLKPFIKLPSPLEPVIRRLWVNCKCKRGDFEYCESTTSNTLPTLPTNS
jgi:hypothetical protein